MCCPEPFVWGWGLIVPNCLTDPGRRPHLRLSSSHPCVGCWGQCLNPPRIHIPSPISQEASQALQDPVWNGGRDRCQGTGQPEAGLQVRRGVKEPGSPRPLCLTPGHPPLPSPGLPGPRLCFSLGYVLGGGRGT